MVHLKLPEKKNSNISQWKERDRTGLSLEKHPKKLEEIEEELPLQKRWKSSSSETTNKQSPDSSEFPALPFLYNPLNEPSPLGLRLKKSSSLLELIQKRLSQSNKAIDASGSENFKVGNKKDIKARVGTSGPIDKLKASNFPAGSLRIGKWEYVSQHEGDLVAKCYFAKHKLVWEVLYGELKNKIEIQWADIVGLKANCPDNGPGSLTIVLGNRPLFFRETDPQPRKHTLWQATSDFTDGNASTYRQHYLQCAHGVLNKHYEKLIQCDTRLNFLSQQLDTVLDLPFAEEASIKDPNVSGNNVSSRPEILKGSSVSGVKGMVLPSTSQCPFLNTYQELGSLGLDCRDFTKDAHFPSSDVSIYDFEEYGTSGGCGVQGPETVEQVNSEKKPATILPFIKNVSGGDNQQDILDNISQRPKTVEQVNAEKKPARILPFIENVSGGDNQQDILDNISQCLLGHSLLMTASDDPTLMSRDNALSCFLLDSGSIKTDAGKNDVNIWHDPDCNPMLEDDVKQEDSDNVSGYRKGLGMPRNDSFTDLLHQLPRIESFPSFLFDLSEDGEILNR